MKLKPMMCPNCNAQLHFDSDDQDFCYCSHCGTQVYKDKGKKYITYRSIDDAKIKEAENKKIEIANSEKAAKRKDSIKIFGIIIVLIILIYFANFVNRIIEEIGMENFLAGLAFAGMGILIFGFWALIIYIATKNNKN